MSLAFENLAKISQSRRSSGIRRMDDDGKVGRERGSRNADEQQPEDQQSFSHRILIGSSILGTDNAFDARL
jgi:hypothetical protein